MSLYQWTWKLSSSMPWPISDILWPTSWISGKKNILLATLQRQVFDQTEFLYIQTLKFCLKWSIVKVTQSCPNLCDPIDYTIHGILQARTLEWVAIPFSRGSSQPTDQTQVSFIAGGFFTSLATREAQEYWSGWPIPSPRDLPNSGIKPGSPGLQANSLPAELPGSGWGD